MTEELLTQAANGQHIAVKTALLALDETEQQVFEPILLVLQSLDDRNVLYRIARKIRDLVLGVMATLSQQEQ